MTEPRNVTNHESSVPVILVVDDDASSQRLLTRIFEREGFEVRVAADGDEALALIRKGRVDVIVTDLMMPKTSGVDLLKAVRMLGTESEVILMTAYGTVENAVEAMKQGAYDFVTKPLKKAHIIGVVRRALEKQSLVVENRLLRAELEATKRPKFVGSSPAWQKTMKLVHQAAPSEATVVLMGESGTGKEVLARAIHDESPRRKGPFVAVNCAALPESILEAELFGYERGAFTGAVARRDGRFTLASGGTLLLDEIAETTSAVQAKLLRVLQEGQIDRLGGGTETVDIRLLVATNRDLAAEVQLGRFRADLYYRLNVIAIPLPTLRERRGDIALLADFFLRRYTQKNDKAVNGFSDAALESLICYSWPGNVRELENMIERAVVLTRGSQLDRDDFPPEIASQTGCEHDLNEGMANADAHSLQIPIGMSLEEVEQRLVLETLNYTKGDKRLAAQLLGVATRTIYRRLESVRGN